MSSDEDRAKEILKGFKLYPLTVADKDVNIPKCCATLAALAVASGSGSAS